MGGECQLDDAFLAALLSLVRRCCSETRWTTLQPVLFLLGHAIVANQVRDSFLQPLFLSAVLIDNPSLAQIVKQILLEVAGCASKGDATNYCLDVFVDWMQSGLPEGETEASPLLLFLEGVRRRSVKEETLVEGVAQFFVGHPKESGCRLLEAEKSHLSKQSVHLLEVVFPFITQ